MKKRTVTLLLVSSLAIGSLAGVTVVHKELEVEILAAQQVNEVLDYRLSFISQEVEELDSMLTELEESVAYIEYINQTYPVPMPIRDKLIVVREANKYGIDPNILFGIIRVESSYNSNATNSRSSSRGYGQIIKGTGEWIYEDKLNRGAYDHDYAFDSETNIEMMAWYIGHLIEVKDSVAEALMSYNGHELGYRYVELVLNNPSY